jgi:hypothetical protein
MSVAPKVHAIEDHLVPQIMHFKGKGILGMILWRDYIKIEFVSNHGQELQKRGLMK